MDAPSPAVYPQLEQQVSEEDAGIFFPPGGNKVEACAAHFSSWLPREPNI